MNRPFLAIVGIAYLALGLWCAAAPGQTSAAVGFSLGAGQGESEFVTVYGGLEVALGLLFLLPWLVGGERSALRACVIVHGGLVVFRSVAFARFTGFETTTYVLVAIEWTIFIIAAGLLFRSQPAASDRNEVDRANEA